MNHKYAQYATKLKFHTIGLKKLSLFMYSYISYSNLLLILKSHFNETFSSMYSYMSHNKLLCILKSHFIEFFFNPK